MKIIRACSWSSRSRGCSQARLRFETTRFSSWRAGNDRCSRHRTG
ncbi:hypothetical protein RHECNPAF_12210020 [Rhizobium etli CNPAF512]|nr:hypothetical protein RHECNPAF_12210020 [Rhizobium etli CNPAF512]